MEHLCFARFHYWVSLHWDSVNRVFSTASTTTTTSSPRLPRGKPISASHQPSIFVAPLENPPCSFGHEKTIPYRPDRGSWLRKLTCRFRFDPGILSWPHLRYGIIQPISTRAPFHFSSSLRENCLNKAVRFSQKTRCGTHRVSHRPTPTPRCRPCFNSHCEARQYCFSLSVSAS